MAKGSLWGCNKTAKIGTAQLNVLLHEPIRPMKVPVRLSEDAIVNKRGSKAPFGTFWTNSCGCHRPATRFLRDYEVELQFRRWNQNWEEKKVEGSWGSWNGTTMCWNEFLLTATLLSIEHMTVKEPKHALYKQECWQWWASLPGFFCPFFVPSVCACTSRKIGMRRHTALRLGSLLNFCKEQQRFLHALFKATKCSSYKKIKSCHAKFWFSAACSRYGWVSKWVTFFFNIRPICGESSGFKGPWL